MQADGPDRPGPVPLPDDSWDTAPTRPHSHVRRHGIPRRYLIVGLVLALAVPAVVIPLVFSGEPTPSSTEPVAGGSSSATVASTPAASPSVSTPTTTSEPPPIEIVVGGTKPGEGGFTSLVYEAEAGAPTVRLSRAEVVQLGAGAGVRFTSRSGEIEFESVQVPTPDRYRVTVVYASERDRSIEVRGWRDSDRARLTATSGCCASATVDVRLAPGGDLTIEPSRGDGPLPTIDRIIVEQA